MVEVKMEIKSLEDEMMDEIGKQIAKEIDEGILSNILVETGWIKVEYHFVNNQQAVDIADWMIENCQDKVERLGSDYVFENKQDAEWFILRWT